MKKKKLKKEIAELRSENQALRERIEKLENLSRITVMECSDSEPEHWEKVCTSAVTWYKDYKMKNPTNLDQILRQGL